MNAKLIIAGGRRFADHSLFHKRMREFVINHGRPAIVLCGMAPGADLLGHLWAITHGIQIEPHPAEWDRHGRAAGPIRNRQMAERATHLIAFWNGQSPGTRDMIRVATKGGLEVEVARY